MKSYLTCFFLLLFGCGLNVFAGTASFNKIWLAHNVSWNSRSCLAIKCDVIVRGLKGQDVKFIAYIDSPKGVGHKDKNGSYCTSGGNVCVSFTDRSDYDNCRWKELTLFLPNDEIHPKEGNCTYFVRIGVFYGGSFIGWSEFVSFNMTGEKERENCTFCNGSGKTVCGFCKGQGHWSYVHYSPYPPFSYLADDVCLHCNQSGKLDCWQCKGSGKKLEVQQGNNSGSYHGQRNYGGNSNNSDGSSHSDVYTKCTYCSGSGVCSRCRGSKGEWTNTGYYTGSDSKTWIDCSSCNGSGRCSICYGRGKL